MRKFFVKNILFVLAVNILIKPAWIFLIDRTVQNRVGHAAYGTYQALFNLALIFQIILDFGLNSYNSRMISQKPDSLKEMFPIMLSARIVLILFYASLVFITGLALGYRGWELGLLSGVLLIQGITVMVQYFRSNVAALHHFRTDGILSVTDRFLMIVICGMLLFLPATARNFRIEWFVFCQVGCYGAAMLISFWVLRKISPVPLHFKFHTAGVVQIIKESLPYALLIFLMSIYTRSDVMLIERMAGKEQAGIYSAAYRLLDVGNIFGLMFANMLLPLFGRMLAQKDDIVPIIRVCVNMLLPVAFMAAVGAFFYGTDIMHLLYPAAGVYDGAVFSWLIASLPAFCMMYVYATLLTASGDLKILNRLALLGVGISLGVNFFMIPHYGAWGAAITAFATQSILSLGFIMFASKKNHLPFNLKWTTAHLSFLVLVAAIGYGVHLLPVKWLLQLGVFAVICLGCMFVFRFISVKALIGLFKKEQ